MEANGRDKSVAATLDSIREGGVQIVLVAQQRLGDVRTALDEGRFYDAHQRAQELAARLSALAQAETYIGGFSSSYIVRGADVEPGMVLRQWGRVSEISTEEKPVPGDDPCLHVHLKFEDHEDVEVHADAELVAVRTEA